MVVVVKQKKLGLTEKGRSYSELNYYKKELLNMVLPEKARKARNAYMQNWRNENKEYNKKYAKEWRQANPDKVRQHIENYWNRKAEKSEEG